MVLGFSTCLYDTTCFNFHYTTIYRPLEQVTARNCCSPQVGLGRRLPPTVTTKAMLKTPPGSLQPQQRPRREVGVLRSDHI